MTPPRAAAVVRRAAVKAERVVDTVTLDHEARFRRRVVLATDAGREVLLDLDKPTRLDDGDALKLDDGGLVLVKAAAEPLLRITAASPERLLKLAWHIGNRHTPAEIAADALYIADDHVLADMARGLGGAVEPVSRPFAPERGAYGHGHGHAHPHAHDHDGHGGGGGGG